MDKTRRELGLAMRTKVLGEEHVAKSNKSLDDFNTPFRELVTEYCWGAVWGDPSLELSQRSLLNIAMTAAQGRFQEFEAHFRGALNGGLTREQLRAALTQISVYCGVPTGVECFRVAKKVLDEMQSSDGHSSGV